ncbi:MAG: serine/threonine-protein kinase, partial [Acidobacteriota bacterium]
MSVEKLKKVEEIYHAVLEIAPAMRESFIKNHCGADADLRREVESLLSFENSSEDFLETPPESLVAEMFAEQAAQTDIIGKTIGHYKIIKLLGKGGMGEVFLAEDTKLDRKAAVKFMDEKFVEEKNNLNRFFFEAKSSSALNHPNIITVYEIGEFENRPFIVTEFIDGITLKEHLAKKRLTLGELLDIAIQIASALAAAHKVGIIHRDIKPDNVMIRHDEIVKVLDFGLAKYDSTAIDAEANTRARILTVRGMIMGTPHFMSPEQARGLAVDTRTDIWSFGVLFYQMLTNNLPFQGETTSDVIASILKSEPLPLKHFIPDISPTLENVILKTFRKKQTERPQKIDEILIELKNYRRKIENEEEAVPHNYRITNNVDFDKNTDLDFIHTTAKDPSVYPGKSDSFFSQTIGKAREFPVFASIIGVTFVALLVIAGIAVSKSNLF